MSPSTTPTVMKESNVENRDAGEKANMELTENAKLASEVEDVITTSGGKLEEREDALGRREKRLPKRLEDFIVG